MPKKSTVEEVNNVDCSLSDPLTADFVDVEIKQEEEENEVYIPPEVLVPQTAIEEPEQQNVEEK